MGAGMGAILTDRRITIGAALTAVVALVIYFATRTPPGVSPMDGGASETTAWIALATAFVTGAFSLATAVVQLIQKRLELRATKRG
jgi:hypothetical protein